jgi:hypothetical protein
LAQSGSRDALPRPCPLRTVRATRRGTRLKQAARASRVEVLPRHLEDPLPQPPCVLLMGTPVNGVPLQHVLRSVHRHRRLTCPLVPAVTICSSSPAHLPTSARFRARAPGPVSGQLCHAPGGAPGKTARVSCCLSAAGLRFLRHPVPPGDSAPLTIGLPHRQKAARTRAGFPCSARVRHGWGRVPSLPRGLRCLSRPVNLPDRRTPPSSGRSLFTPVQHSAPGCNCDEASTRVHWRSPLPAFPSPVIPGTVRGPSGFSLSSAPG